MPGIPAAEAMADLRRLAPSSTELPETTHAGQSQRRIESPFPCVLVCKHEDDTIVVVTVLGPNETLSAADQETIAAWEQYIGSAFVRKVMNSDTPAKRETKAEREDRTRRMVDGYVRHEFGFMVDKLVAAEIKRRNDEHGAARKAAIAVEALRAAKRVGNRAVVGICEHALEQIADIAPTERRAP